jgi:thiol-disulfide isomerase/thioredoxin
MLERVALLAGVALLLMVAVPAVRWWASHRLGRRQRNGHESLWSTLGEQPDGRAALVVFSAPGCAACRTAQEPVVDVVAERFGAALRVINVDIARQPNVARAFGVLTAPSSALVAGDGPIRSVNHGFAGVDALSDQLSALGVSPRSPR